MTAYRKSITLKNTKYLKYVKLNTLTNYCIVKKYLNTPTKIIYTFNYLWNQKIIFFS